MDLEDLDSDAVFAGVADFFSPALYVFRDIAVARRAQRPSLAPLLVRSQGPLRRQYPLHHPFALALALALPHFRFLYAFLNEPKTVILQTISSLSFSNVDSVYSLPTTRTVLRQISLPTPETVSRSYTG